jgi:hypothetical protein
VGAGASVGPAGVSVGLIGVLVISAGIGLAGDVGVGDSTLGGVAVLSVGMKNLHEIEIKSAKIEQTITKVLRILLSSFPFDLIRQP